MKKLIFAISLVAMFLFGACTTSKAHAEQTWPLKIWYQNSNGHYNTYCVVDDDTGVNYVVVSTGTSGYGEYSIAITPRLNADGSLYVTK